MTIKSNLNNINHTESLKRARWLSGLLYVSSVQYFIVQLITANRWSKPYNISRNTISDLGNTKCGQYGGRYVCSPLHATMEASFICLGITMIIGSMMLLRLTTDKWLRLGFSFLCISGVGVILVGLFPENTISALHSLGAGFCFTIGNFGFLIAGKRLSLPRPLKAYTYVAAIASLCAFGLLVSDHYVGLGEGGMERIVAYPQTIWLIFVGIYLIFSEIRRLSSYAGQPKS
jgi:hypothetical membrane protein